MKKQELTDWYPPHIKPVRVGWYHTGFSFNNPTNNARNESDGNWWWDGSIWLIDEDGEICYAQDRWWRGIKK